VRFEYWRHKPTGELWAVHLDERGVVRACGPIWPDDAPMAILPHFPYRTVDVPWIEAHRDDFTGERSAPEGL
jgi:hypothetical protein